MQKYGFTLSELLIIIAVFSLLFLLGIPALHLFQRETSLKDAAEEIKNVLLLAQSKATSSEGSRPHGVFFNSSSTPPEYTLFRGDTFSLREASFDLVYQLPKTIEFSQIDFASGSEVVFQKLTREATQPGFLVLRIKSQPENTRTVSVNASGAVFVGTLVAPSDSERLTDSRHVHFDYNRVIDTSATTSENFILTFTGNSGPFTKTVKISDYLQAGNFVWVGSVTVDGEVQQIEIRTHRLNNPDTQFSITRDRRKNTKALKIELSADTSGTLIEYSANGQETRGTSSFLAPGTAGTPQRQ